VVLVSDKLNRKAFELVRVLVHANYYYMPKFMDAFSELPLSIQKSLVIYIADQVGTDRWDEYLRDDTQYLDFWGHVLHHYSGSRGSGTPSREDLARLVAKYIREEYPKVVEEGPGFMQELESL